MRGANMCKTKKTKVMSDRSVSQNMLGSWADDWLGVGCWVLGGVLGHDYLDFNTVFCNEHFYYLCEHIGEHLKTIFVKFPFDSITNMFIQWVANADPIP